MGWIVTLFGVVLLVVIVSKALDRETARNLKYLGKLFVVVIIFIVMMVFLSFNNH